MKSQSHSPPWLIAISLLAALILVGIPPERATAQGFESNIVHSVVSVQASNRVLHGLQVKSSVDEERGWANLKGPEFYSFPDNVSDNETPGYLTWYELRKPAPEGPKALKLTDAYSDGNPLSIALGQPAFFLMPSQTVVSGPPSEIPATLNHFKLYRIANLAALKVSEKAPGRLAYVGVPAEEWHHSEHYPIKSPKTFLMVYEWDAEVVDGNVTTIDQFGLNSLTKSSKRYVYVLAKESK